MKLKIQYLILIGLIFPFIVVSCISPPPEPRASVVDRDLGVVADQVSLETIAAARAEAVKAGADKLVPERFAHADAVAESAGEKFESGDLKGFAGDGKEAQDRYKVLQIIAEAHNKQAEADRNDFFSVDPDSYMLAAEAGNEAVDLYDENELPEALIAAEDALNRFSQVIKNGWISKFDEKLVFAEESRIASQEAKANIASKPEYDAAEQIYNIALAAQDEEDYAKASESFHNAGGLFVKAYNSTVTKRQRAEEALYEAEQKLAESEEKAQAASDLIGGE
jgi:hypothetical protein